MSCWRTVLSSSSLLLIIIITGTPTCSSEYQFVIIWPSQSSGSYMYVKYCTPSVHPVPPIFSKYESRRYFEFSGNVVPDKNKCGGNLRSEGQKSRSLGTKIWKLLHISLWNLVDLRQTETKMILSVGYNYNTFHHLNLSVSHIPSFTKY